MTPDSNNVRPGMRGAGSAPDTSARRGAASRAAQQTVQVKAGDWIVRMDQPYTQYVRTIMAIQRYKPDDPAPYDDTGWTLDELQHVTTYTIPDSSVLAKPMQPLTADATVAGTSTGSGPVLLVKHLGDWRSAVLP